MIANPLRKNKNTGQFSLKIRLRWLAYRLSRTSLPEITFMAILILVRWHQNSDFQYPSEIFLPLILLAVLASLVYYGYRAVLGTGLAAHGAALLLTYGLYSYGHIASYGYVKGMLNVLPDNLATPFTKSLVLAAVMAVVCGLVGWAAGFLTARFRSLQALQPLKVILFAIAFLFGLQLVRVSDRLLDIRGQLSYQPEVSALAANSSSPPTASLPDIYYLVFDRYTNAQSLKDIYQYDNSGLLDFLNQQGFVNRPDAYANYPYTMPSLASTLNMDYLTDLEARFGQSGKWQTGFPYRSILQDPALVQTLRAKGYNYNLLSSWSDYTRIRIKADDRPTQSFRLALLGKDFFLSDLERDILNKSIFSPWLKKGLTVGDNRVIKYDLDRHPRENFEAQMTALRDLSAKDQSRPQFSFAHILAPHDPYVFDRDGQAPPYDPNRTDNGIDETQKYLNEIIYINRRLMELVSHIRSTSPGAVIIIQSDEGSYPKQFRTPLTAASYYDPADLPTPQMRQKMGILVSYFLPGVQPAEVAALDSSVNSFRLVLNKYLGYNLPMLPACHFSTGNKFVIYDFELINQRLTGRPAPEACRNL